MRFQLVNRLVHTAVNNEVLNSDILNTATQVEMLFTDGARRD